MASTPSFVDLLNSQKECFLSDSFLFASTPTVELQSSQLPAFPEECEPADEVHSEPKERHKWTPTDDLVLISAWLNTSKDPVVGNEQKSGAFWKRIAAYVAASPKLVGREVREHTHCKARWSKIQQGVSKFCGFYDAAVRDKTSGQNDDDVVKAARAMYYAVTKTKFTLDHAWLELRHDQKWCQLSTAKNGNGGKKRRCEDGAPSASSMAMSEQANQTNVRPPGVKSAKSASKKKVMGGMVMGPLSPAEFQSMFDRKEQDNAVRVQLSKSSLLERLLARKETLTPAEIDLKDKLVSDLVSGKF